MYTVYVAIGNSDDKLSQPQWSKFWRAVNRCVRGEHNHVHFSGCSDTREPWQNAMWCVEVADAQTVHGMREYLNRVRVEYNQDSIAWTCVLSEHLEFISETPEEAVNGSATTQEP
jgi:hypothetical protein